MDNMSFNLKSILKKHLMRKSFQQKRQYNLCKFQKKPYEAKFSKNEPDLIKIEPFWTKASQILPKCANLSHIEQILARFLYIFYSTFPNDEKGMLLKLIFSFKFSDKRSKHIWKPFSETAAVAVMHARCCCGPNPPNHPFWSHFQCPYLPSSWSIFFTFLLVSSH